MPYVTLDFTPNPRTLKYVTDKRFADRVYNFKTRSDAENVSQRAADLFLIDGVQGVMVGQTFVTIVRDENLDIEKLHDAVMERLGAWVNSDDIITAPAVAPRSLTAVEQRIVDFIQNDVRPAVAQDGGNIEFERFEDGIVYLSLEGSCAGCPSSVMTLKGGIERRLKQIVPEVTEVVSV